VSNFPAFRLAICKGDHPGFQFIEKSDKLYSVDLFFNIEVMPARDIYHDIVRNALIKEGWKITDDPLLLPIGSRSTYIDLGAEKLIAAERDTQKIAVEVKSFISPSLVSDLEKAWGQFFMYSRILQKLEPDRQLYLAVNRSISESLFNEEIGKLLLDEPGFQMIVFDPIIKEIIQWIP
jgi:hypothetical protein